MTKDNFPKFMTIVFEHCGQIQETNKFSMKVMYHRGQMLEDNPTIGIVVTCNTCHNSYVMTDADRNDP